MTEHYRIIDIVYVVTEVVIGVLAIIFNVVLMTVLWKYRRMRTLTTKVVSNLGVAGMYAGVVWPVLTALPPAHLPQSLYPCLMVICIIKSAYTILILSLVLVVVDRYCHVFHPVPYLHWTTYAHVRGMMVITWIVGFVIGMVPLIWHREATKGFDCSRVNALDFRYVVYFHFLGFLLPVLLTVSVLFIRVFHTFKENKLQVRRKSLASCSTNPSETILRRKEIFLFERLVAIFMVLVVTSLPVYTYQAVEVWVNSELPSLEVTRFLQALSHVSSFIIPLVYIYNRREFHLIVSSVWPLHHKHSPSYQSIQHNVPCPKSPTSGFTLALKEVTGTSRSCQDKGKHVGVGQVSEGASSEVRK